MSRRKIDFVETTTAQTMRAALDMASMMGFPVLVVGDSGLGKTEALKKLHAENRAAYLEVSQHTKAIKPMILMVLAAYKIRPSHKFTFDLGQEVLQYLNDRDIPLIVDEYQNLTPPVLRELFFFQERCGFPLLLSGNRERLASTKRDTGAMEQIESRIGQRFQVGKPTRLDCTNIGIGYNVEGRDAYEAIGNYGQNTSLRLLCQLLDKCEAATGGVGSIGLRHIEMVLRPAGRNALKLLTPDPSA